MFGAPKPRCRRGRSIRTLGALLKVLDAEPSVWVSYVNRPLPSTVVASWQLRFVRNQVRLLVFSRVIRPTANSQPGF